MKKLVFVLVMFGNGIISNYACHFFVGTKLQEVKGCKSIEDIYTVIDDAIYIGAPTYNEGNHLACYRIYEGAAYKIINLYGSKCVDIKKLLQLAIKTCEEYNSPSERAWVLRTAFDAILGVPTVREKAK